MPSFSPVASTSSPILRSVPIGSLPSSASSSLMIPPPPEFADYHTETRGRSRNPKELPYFTYSPSSSPSRSSASSDAGDSGFSRTFDLGPALEDHHRRQTGQGNGLGLSFGTPSNQAF